MKDFISPSAIAALCGVLPKKGTNSFRKKSSTTIYKAASKAFKNSIVSLGEAGKYSGPKTQVGVGTTGDKTPPAST